MKTRRQKTIDAPTMAAGGVVVIAGRSPLIAVVKRRKDDGWVLPRGKLRAKESALAVALREVQRETGHVVTAREFLGSVSYESGGRPKIVQFWLMASRGQAGRERMSDVKAVKWLSLNAAVATLTEPLEQSFLAEIGKQHRDKLKKRMNGRHAPKARATAPTGEGVRRKRMKRRAPSSDSPSFIRSFFQRLTHPRSISSRGHALSG